MRLRVTTPLAVVVEVDDVRHVRAEDETGMFGVQTHHAGLLTVLAISVLSWRDGAGHEHHVAVRCGVLSVRSDVVEVATRDAVASDDLAQLERDVLARFRQQARAEEAARGSTARLELAAIRRIYDYVRGERSRPAISVSKENGDERA
jgi:F-type H+-transporting ATPase subunit epsilon